MNIDDIVEEFREANYNHFDEFYNQTKKNVFFSIAAIVIDNSVIDDLMQDTYIKFLENIISTLVITQTTLEQIGGIVENVY